MRGGISISVILVWSQCSGAMTRLWCLWLVLVIAITAVMGQSQDREQTRVAHWTRLRSLQLQISGHNLYVNSRHLFLRRPVLREGDDRVVRIRRWEHPMAGISRDQLRTLYSRI